MRDESKWVLTGNRQCQLLAQRLGTYRSTLQIPNPIEFRIAEQQR